MLGLRSASAVMILVGVAACGSASASRSMATRIDGATVASDVQVLGTDLTAANLIPGNLLFGTCTAGDYNQLQTEVAAGQWPQASAYAADVSADVSTIQNEMTTLGDASAQPSEMASLQTAAAGAAKVSRDLHSHTAGQTSCTPSS